ncbi:PREDICTED: uncharacterized protein LOC104165639 [Cariama cristata]|uniref:uncharacterized protein LOC104165639 n=1 Tax=Cariama cristata TaxID=54380 RepID=UPI0005209BDB|nr:PREDICTED: uncharacterized protein LOC104165639 [Cariama cristata]
MSSQYENNTQKGRYTINEDTQVGVLSITMEKLTVQDTGDYWCALYDDSCLFRIKEIKTVFISLRVQTLDAEERRLEGSTLYIQCPYNGETQYWHLKAWCRVRDYSCEPLVEISSTQHPYSKQVTKEKVTIEDYPVNRTVSITMTNLQAEDSGTYSCAYHYNYLPLKTISLSIFKELHKWELDSLSVQCPYSSLRYSTGTKAWCRTEGQTACKNVVRTDYPSTQRNSKALVDRTSIQDDTQKRTVTITMEKLQAQDTGTYLCVIYRGSHPTWKMEVRLSVSKRYRRTPQQGRVTIQDDSQQGIVTITMEKLEAQDSGVYWCALHEQSRLFRMEEVTLNISDALARTTLSGTAGTNQATPGKTPAPSSNVNTFILLSGVLSILFILALISLITLGIRRRKQLQRQGNRQAEDTYDKPEHIYDKPEDTAQLDSTERMESPKDDSKDLKYVTLNFKSRLIPEDPLYCNVEPSQAHRKPKDENVEYASIAFKQLPTNDKG